MKRFAIFWVLTWSATAGEYAVFTSGARLRVERHETQGSRILLYSKTGTTELDAALVAGFELEDYVPPPDPAAPVAASTPQQLVDAAAKKYNLPPAFLRSLVQAESGFHTNAVSPKGAIGLMQLMPATASRYGADPADPAQNVEAGVRYLSELLRRYDGGVWHALAAYNAGPGAVDKYHGIPPYPETQAYVSRVVRNWQKY